MADPHDDEKPGTDLTGAVEQDERRSQSARTRRLAWSLSLAGFLPFLVLTAAVVFMEEINPVRPIVLDALKTYSAIILSFLGGIRWGVAMKDRNPVRARRAFVMSVIPSLIGWFGLFLPHPYIFGVFALAFAAQGAWDSLSGATGAFGDWFVRLRIWLTLLVTAAMITAFFATLPPT